MGSVADEKATAATIEAEHDAVFSEKADINDFKASAIEAENAEHNMTVLQAVRAYPMASFWAFIISCTIVSVETVSLAGWFLSH